MKKLIENIIVFIVIMFLITSVMGFVLDRPVLISYAYSESMTPTINKGDLFFINPLSKGGEVGDIIVFHRRDGWTVHRIFAVTDEGYITKGDNNVATDQQDGAYPPVNREDIIGKVMAVGNHPLVIRGGGALIESARSKLTNIYAVAVILLLGAFLTFSGGNNRRGHGRKKRFLKLSMRTVYAVVSVGIVAGFIFVTVASWGTLAFTYSSTLASGQMEGWYLPGSTFEKNLSIENRAIYPFHYFIGTKSVRVTILNEKQFKIDGKGSHEVLMKVSVPEDTKIYREEIEVRSYPAILPGRLVAAMYKINPYLPLIPYTLELAAILLALYYMADIGQGEVIRIRIRRRSLLSKIAGDG
ncbi:signal peptidase I [Thermococcus pacificus]|uniref:S26 family signal peptidase n=1 Tax=Thermococcus pacificus TaxID=71998 RepID=A0A218P6N4_9EURY|nr:signal peptidase I [Thermococcus pacificus]ASJ06443.1 S26 family signal peptidase [Thermococcus pacificus]